MNSRRDFLKAIPAVAGAAALSTRNAFALNSESLPVDQNGKYTLPPLTMTTMPWNRISTNKPCGFIMTNIIWDMLMG